MPNRRSFLKSLAAPAAGCLTFRDADAGAAHSASDIAAAMSDDELLGYVELLAEEKIRGGMSPEQARREARLELGGVEFALRGRTGLAREDQFRRWRGADA